MTKKFPFDRINWVTSSFLIGTLVISIVGVPLYIWQYGLSLNQIVLFLLFYIATGISITLGYHRLFSHLAFKAKWPVKLFTLIFGAASFENSCLDWCSDHRRHHKHVDHDEDPYDISKGFFHAHIGWLLFKLRPEPPQDNVPDLQKDKLVMWQHNWFVPLGMFFGFVVPTLLGWWLDGGMAGAIGGFLIPGVLRIVCVQHSTFFINSLCHTVGNRPYSERCSARDSWIMALFTFGEGYHNYHHEFQHDYRNGVKPWQFDPTKWSIWVLSKLGLASNLRRVPHERILLAEMNESHRKISDRLEEMKEMFSHLPEKTQALFHEQTQKLHQKSDEFSARCAELQEALKEKVQISKDTLEAWHKDVREAMYELEVLSRKLRPIRT